MKISSKLIKELRNLTGIGIMECKNALIYTKGNISQAIDYIRKNFKLQAIKKHKNITKEGFITGLTTQNFGVLLEINCQTDFVAKDRNLVKFACAILKYIHDHKNINIYDIRYIFNEKLLELINILKENIIINKLQKIDGNFIGQYIHHNKRIGVILQSNIDNILLMKNIAMHIAMQKPEYISENNIPQKLLKHEYNIQKNIAEQINKSDNIIKKIVEGRIQKFINNITLYNQPFLLDTNKLVIDYLKSNNMIIKKFIRFEIGEK
ncbi:translation elongation factor Ts [Enterobacteriaceae endosymbiont of Neohaemonia nigricornis]|uniref:translation elongation factor Ts n=1 Tax=Enterobacteriaceae endosymbiont of Neohaemonia nigricornis TaxID=2675792 RepID=UPI0014493E3F|nr:translation elongation factor Ts [Enterobacteriaceae endosymbiont of Neohaemonia nigricornis]QJC30425.1 translation elongation factor Ts [Enterobacteriaceae endosymbiont of Neohaemonia nigricornis]